MSELLNAPIAGQSLTDEPKNYPWERPPEITDPRQAIKFHLEGLNNPASIDNVIELMQIGIPVEVLAKTALTTAQMEGIHSVDVSLIIKDVIKEELTTMAEEAGIDYTVGNEPDEAALKEKEDQQVLALLRKKLSEIEPGSTEDDSGVEIMRQTADMMEDSDAMEPPMMDEPQQQQEMPMEEPTEAPRGLMARG